MEFSDKQMTVLFPIPRGKREVEAFGWIRHETEFHRFTSEIILSYKDGFSVTFYVPLAWSEEQLMDVIINAKYVFNDKFVASKFQ